MILVLFHRHKNGLSPVAISFKLRTSKCNIADKKKLKVKLVAEINVKYNRNLSSLGMIGLKLGVKIVGESDYSTNCNEVLFRLFTL